MKRILALLLAVTVCLNLTACDAYDNPAAIKTGTDKQTENGDLAYVQDKGTLVVGITEFAPMDYQDAEGNWIGFDADMATAFAESLGVTAEFRLIPWDDKIDLLNDKTIDVVWNGMTLNDEVKASMEISKPYFNNAQVVIVRADTADQYQTVESLTNAVCAVEPGSAGQNEAVTHGLSYMEVKSQSAALQNVSDGTYDAAIIDFLMAITMIGEGTAYEELTYTVSLNSEEYGVGFRKGSDLAAELNSFFAANYANGIMQSIARTYGISAFLLAQ